MQAPAASRSMRRRSPGPESGALPNIPPTRTVSPAVGTGLPTRPSSSRASGSGSVRRTESGSNPSVPLSQIEKSVTHLLYATKQLLETLTRWSRREASDTDVSDVYVRLGYEFNMACRAFSAINVDTADLGNVPELLRNILESTLSQEASVQSLDNYLPKIRDIIINLLHGLKRKQQKLRQRQARERDSGSGDMGRTTSVSTVGSANSGLTTLLNEGLETGYRADNQGEESKQGKGPATAKRRVPRDNSQTSLASEDTSMSSSTMQSIPIVPPYPGDESSLTSPGDMMGLDNFPPPPPPPKGEQQSALIALQRGGDLERRASRRYSAYQISKHLGAAGAVPMMPPQTGPAPNRGARTEAHETMRAMQRRDNVRHTRSNANVPKNQGASPVRIPSRVTEADTSEELELLNAGADGGVPATGSVGKPSPTRGPPRALPAQRSSTPDEKHVASFMLENSPTTEQPKDLTLFLQYKSKVKKFVLPDGPAGLSIGRLQLAFIDKFSWNTQQNGADLPDIYIQDPVSGVRHELEDLADVKDRTVLVLNVEPLDEVKRHIDEGLGSIRKIMQEVKQNVDDHGLALRQVSERQDEAAKDVARMAAAPPPIVAAAAPASTGSTRKASPGELSELRSLRRDLAVLRQTYSRFQSEIQGSMSTLRSKAAKVKATTAKLSVPKVDVDSGYVSNGRKQMHTDSDSLVTKVDDLQDLVEDLRKDVVMRGVRPLPRQLETVSKDITTLTKELKKMDDNLKREKPVWTKIWEKELEEVCNGQEELRMLEDLLIDLRDDLEKASETFGLVEAATKEQMKDAGATNPNGTTALQPGSLSFSGRALKRLDQLGNNAAVDPSAAKEGVLDEVRALQPNHEDRLEAIERAEKLRQRELETRLENPLTRELTDFVGEGKLKKSGGVEEVERARKTKDERIRREFWGPKTGGDAADAAAIDDAAADEPSGEESNDAGLTDAI